MGNNPILRKGLVAILVAFLATFIAPHANVPGYGYSEAFAAPADCDGTIPDGASRTEPPLPGWAIEFFGDTNAETRPEFPKEIGNALLKRIASIVINKNDGHPERAPNYPCQRQPNESIVGYAYRFEGERRLLREVFRYADQAGANVRQDDFWTQKSFDFELRPGEVGLMITHTGETGSYGSVVFHGQVRFEEQQLPASGNIVASCTNGVTVTAHRGTTTGVLSVDDQLTAEPITRDINLVAGDEPLTQSSTFAEIFGREPVGQVTYSFDGQFVPANGGPAQPITSNGEQSCGEDLPYGGNITGSCLDGGFQVTALRGRTTGAISVSDQQTTTPVTFPVNLVGGETEASQAISFAAILGREPVGQVSYSFTGQFAPFTGEPATQISSSGEQVCGSDVAVNAYLGGNCTNGFSALVQNGHLIGSISVRDQLSSAPSTFPVDLRAGDSPVSQRWSITDILGREPVGQVNYSYTGEFVPSIGEPQTFSSNGEQICGEPTNLTAQCRGVGELEFNSETFTVTGTAQGSDNATAMRVVRTDTGEVVQEPSSNLTTVQFGSAERDVQYQVQYQGLDGSWSDTGCTFSFASETPVEKPLTFSMETCADCYNRLVGPFNVQNGVLDQAIPVNASGNVPLWYVVEVTAGWLDCDGESIRWTADLQIKVIGQNVPVTNERQYIIVPSVVSTQGFDMEVKYSKRDPKNHSVILEAKTSLRGVPGVSSEKLASCVVGTGKCTDGLFVHMTEPIAYWDSWNQTWFNESYTLVNLVKPSGDWHPAITLSWGGFQQYPELGTFPTRVAGTPTFPTWYTTDTTWFTGSGNYQIGDGTAALRQGQPFAGISIPQATFDGGVCEPPTTEKKFVDRCVGLGLDGQPIIQRFPADQDPGESPACALTPQGGGNPGGNDDPNGGEEPDVCVALDESGNEIRVPVSEAPTDLDANPCTASSDAPLGADPMTPVAVSVLALVALAAFRRRVLAAIPAK